ncbi:transferrin receptor-like dimerization domain-containing protein [Scytonema sp. PCC 10023]|uniref:transferrin receptor-like dimerization domain-containing protein n=1 Tax=Scytonema sp. PCC 10023 TaxID=1680591 RepID=UPI0039C6B1E2
MIDVVWRRFFKVRNTFRFGVVVLLSCVVIVIAIKQVQGSATQKQTLEQLIGKPIAQQIETHVRALASKPHEAGTDANTKTAQYYAKKLREYGFDEVIFNRYEVLLPRPVKREVTLLQPESYNLKLIEPPIPSDPDSYNQALLPPFNPYAADGDVTAPVVYVNYGLSEDYAVLDSMGISVKGKIVIARYGRSWRGVKSRLAAQRGAVGCLLYSDPADDGYVKGKVIPEGKWRPEFGVQTGSVLDIPKYPGDPLTPMQPSKPGVDRLTQSSAVTLEKIPVLPISYGDALPILRNLDGKVVPKEWQGGLPITYRIGDNAAVVRMQLQSDWSVRPIVNVIGILRGKTEPEKIVMVGSHRDAWGFGANDPVAGESSLLESARTIGELAKQGHRPQRSIAIASWDAEEYGMIGSTEYGEEFQDTLKGNVVVYLNREFYIAADFNASGVASLQPLLNQITKEVQMPDSDKSIFEAWRESQQNNTVTVNGMQEVRLDGLGAGSDYMVFMHHLGIPSLDFGFGGADDYGGYHSRYDSYWFFKNYGDPGIAYGERLTELVSLFLLRMADARVLPFDYASYSEAIDRYIDELSEVAQKHSVALDIDRIRAANIELRTTAQKLNAETAQIATMSDRSLEHNQKAISRLNNLLLRAESAFLDQNGLPRRPWYRHQIYAPGYDTGYNAEPLPGVREAIERKDTEQTEQMTNVLVSALNRVRDTLQEAFAVALEVNKAT